jgi:peptidoglycan hydrolase CwlO-like protein
LLQGLGFNEPSLDSILLSLGNIQKMKSSALIAALLALSLSACGEKAAETAAAPAAPAAEAAAAVTAASEAAPAPVAAEGAK